jgi:hypothetical protein
VSGTIPERIRWAVETLDIMGSERVLEIGGGPGVAASIICERLESGSMHLIDRSATAAGSRSTSMSFGLLRQPKSSRA